MTRILALAALAALGLGGCLLDQNSPSTLLRDQVYGLNDEVRFARLDLASERVAPSYRQTFLRSHARWGGEVRIAEQDMAHIRLAEDSDSATSVVTVSWYDLNTMTVRRTVIRQRWVRSGESFALAGETLLGGEEGLLDLPDDEEPPAEDRATSAGGEDAPGPSDA